MSNFSIKSITAHLSEIESQSKLCTEALKRLAGIAGDLDSDLAKQSKEKLEPYYGVRHVLTALQHLLDKVINLSNALQATSTLSMKLQNEFRRVLPQCQDTIALVLKHLTRLETVPIDNIKQIALETISSGIYHYSSLSTHFITCLSEDDHDAQDALLASEDYQQELHRATMSSQLLSHTTSDMFYDIPAPAPKVQVHSGKGNQPPPYEEPPRSGESSEARRRSSATSDQATNPNKVRGFKGFASLTNGLQAMMSGRKGKANNFTNALCEAVKRGDVLQMKGLLAQGADVNGRAEDGKTPVQTAIVSHQEDALQLLIKSNAELKATSTYSKLPPLYLAASIGNLDAASLLNKAGVRPEILTASSEACMVDVVRKGNADGVRFLLEKGANPYARSTTGRSVLALAIDVGHEGVARALLDYGADVHAVEATGGSILTTAMHSGNGRIVGLLLENGLNANAKTLTGTPILSEAVKMGHYDTAMALLHHGADANAKDLTGTPVLMTALQGKLKPAEKLELAEKLLEKGAHANITDVSGHTLATAYIMQSGNSVELLELMLSHGADANATLPAQEPLLFRSLRCVNYDYAKALLEHGADPNAKSRITHDLPLVIAMMRKDERLIRLLREYGADEDLAGRERLEELAEGRPDLLHSLQGSGGREPPPAEVVLQEENRPDAPPEYEPSPGISRDTYPDEKS